MKGLTILFLLICPFCWSQTELEIPPHPPIPKELGPPVQAEGPSKENMVLIDSLLNVCKFEQDFIAICEMRIEQEANLKKWDAKHVQWRKSKIDYQKFKESTVYDSFSGVTSEELTLLINTFTILNKNHKLMPFFLSNGMISNNLEIEIKGFLE